MKLSTKELEFIPSLVKAKHSISVATVGIAFCAECWVEHKDIKNIFEIILSVRVFIFFVSVICNYDENFLRTLGHLGGIFGLLYMFFL